MYEDFSIQNRSISAEESRRTPRSAFCPACESNVHQPMDEALCWTCGTQLSEASARDEDEEGGRHAGMSLDNFLSLFREGLLEDDQKSKSVNMSDLYSFRATISSLSPMEWTIDGLTPPAVF